MESGRRPGAFSPKFTASSPPSPRYSRDRSLSVDSDSSASSQTTSMSQPGKRGQTPNQSQARPTVYASPRSNTSTPVLQNYSRPTIAHVVSDSARRNSPLNPGSDRPHKRNNSQGFFEPSLPTLADSPTALTGGMPPLTPSQIAAQTAMQGFQGLGGPSNQYRRRSTTASPVMGQDNNGNSASIGQAKPMPVSSSQSQQGQLLASGSRKGSTSAANNLAPSTGIMGPPGAAAASAASAAYPGSGQLSPGLTSFSSVSDLTAVEKTPRSKAERAKQMFSKNKQITVPNQKDLDRKDKAGPVTAKLPSPGLASLYPLKSNASVASLADTASLAPPSLYTVSTNASTSTLVPVDRGAIEMPPSAPPLPAKEKEPRHRTNIFSRPKKHKDKDDHPLTLSSAASNSKIADPNAPQSIYSFAPSSPAPSQMGFGKVGGHAAKKKKEKEEFDFGATFGPTTTATGHFLGGTPVGYESANNALQGFGLHHMTAEDAWDFLKAKLLVIFEGGMLTYPVEDLNRLVSVHIQRCVQKNIPNVALEDLRDLLNTGFLSLDQTLRRTADERLVPQLVEMWLFVFGTLLPYMQAVFLPLDLELRGHGTMSAKEATEFWGLPVAPEDGGSGGEEELDVRRCVLLSFRDNVILPRHDILKQVFSRLSLESINIFPDSPLPMPPFGAPPSGRPGTAGSLDPTQSSFNSQSSTLLSDSSRSRATSNTSAPELPTFSPTNPNRPGTGGQGSSAGGGGGQPDSSQVTETVGRMLQCMSVLVSVHSEDSSQEKMEDLTKTLKLNWLGRGRTGRNRKGLVGARVPRRTTPVMG